MERLTHLPIGMGASAPSFAASNALSAAAALIFSAAAASKGAYDELGACPPGVNSPSSLSSETGPKGVRGDGGGGGLATGLRRARPIASTCLAPTGTVALEPGLLTSNFLSARSWAAERLAGGLYSTLGDGARAGEAAGAREGALTPSPASVGKATGVGITARELVGGGRAAELRRAASRVARIAESAVGEET